MSVVGSQQQTFLRLLGTLRPHWRRDVNLPARIQALLARSKDFGSRDRRLYRELIYTTVRHLSWIEPLLDTDADRATRMVAWLAAETRDTTAYRAETVGDWPAIESLRERAAFLGTDAAVLLPAWFRQECAVAFEPPELDALLARAPLWLRLQTGAVSAVAAEFTAAGWHWQPSAIQPTAWRMEDEIDVTKSAAFARGAVEVQDLGSQLVLASIGIEAGGRWLDACAGAGGKTLQLARLVGPTGAIDAFDTRREALAELVLRAARLAAPVAAPPPEGASAAEHSQLGEDKSPAPIRVLDTPPGATPVRRRGAILATPGLEAYAGVLVDAPCSGSGTWRRSPHLKWTSSPKIVADRSGLQQVLLDRYSRCVAPGGRLVYATCSLAHRENEAVVASFLAAHPEFEPKPFADTFGFTPSREGMTILPSRHDTDGFFVASLRRR